MSGTGSPDTMPDGTGMKVTIVAASWHERVMDALLASAVASSEEAGATVTVVRAPGAFELPVLCQAAANAGADAVVALGVVIRGGTPHFDYVCDAVTAGVLRVTLDSGVPVGFGVLTCDNEMQALDRAGISGSSHEDKGREAAFAAIATAAELRRLKQA